MTKALLLYNEAISNINKQAELLTKKYKNKLLNKKIYDELNDIFEYQYIIWRDIEANNKTFYYDYKVNKAFIKKIYLETDPDIDPTSNIYGLVFTIEVGEEEC